jgi:hemerythrin superfamily protein
VSRRAPEKAEQATTLAARLATRLTRRGPIINLQSKGDDVDALKLLTEQHAKVKKLFREFESEDNEDEKRSTFKEVADDLAAHSEIEEKIFYPAVYVGDLKDQLREAVEEHLAVKRALADLMDLGVGAESFDAKMRVVQEQVEHHIEEEEKQLFPRVRRNFISAELEELGSQMEALFRELERDEPRTRVAAETDRAARLE